MLHVLLTIALASISSAAGQDIEREAREIEEALIAPCCYSQQVSVHQSPAAEEVRKDIRRRLAAGETRADIIHAYRRQYGDRILAEPPDEGFNRLLRLVPILMLLLTATLVGVLVRRFVSRGPQLSDAAPAPSASGASRYDQQLEDELLDLD